MGLECPNGRRRMGILYGTTTMNALTAIRAAATKQLELTILMPCLNEAETLAVCIGKARAFLDKAGILGEVLIADNGSTDGSQEIAAEGGARVVPVAPADVLPAARGFLAAPVFRFVVHPHRSPWRGGRHPTVPSHRSV